MAQSKIIQSLCDLVEEKKIVESQDYEKQFDKAFKWEKILRNYIGEDKKFQKIFLNYTIEEGTLESLLCDKYFREGFLCGARLALEICGFERTDKTTS